MSEDALELIVSIIINFFDLIMIYYFCHNLIDKIPKFSVRTFFAGILCGIVIGTLANNLTEYTFRILITVVALLILKLISRKKIHDLLIIYAIMLLCISFVQTPALLIIGSLDLNQAYTFLLAQILTLIIIMFLCLNVPLYKLLHAVEKEILLKLSMFTLTGIWIVMLFYFNFQYTTSYLLYFSLLIAIALIGLYRTLKRIFFYTNTVPMQLHDVKNILLGVCISAHTTSDINRVRDELNKSLEIIGMDTHVENIDVDEYNKNILSFINQKKGKVLKELTFSTDVHYYESNTKVPFSVILYMLGVLLDNAIESSTKVVLIKVSVIEESLMISVSNEYTRKSKDDFQKMFQKRYSTKEAHLRGYGLPNLNKVVSNYGGKIHLKCEYNMEQQSDYLTIIIDIRN